jgi:magnesium transporter
MAEMVATKKSQLAQTFFLSEILGAKVYYRGKRIGSLSDMIMVDDPKVAQVTHFYITRPFGYAPLTVPWSMLKLVSLREIELKVKGLEKYEKEPKEHAVFVKDHLLDKKVLDTEGREVEVVYDVKLLRRNNKIYVSDVDLSRYGLLRRIGLKSLADFIYGLANRLKRETLSWRYVQPLPGELTSFRGEVKLNILKEKLAEVHPVDLADILEELNHEQRVKIFDKLDKKQASDTLEEIDPNVQRELVSSLSTGKVVQLIKEMTPGQAADLLAVLPSADAETLMLSMDPHKARKIKSIIEKQEEKIINYATQNCIKIPPQKTVRQAKREYARLAKGKDVIMYLYIVDAEEKLLGVIDIKELLQAKDDALLRNIMIDNVITLNPDNTLKDASAMFERYDFRAIPIKGANDKFLGVVPYRDVMNLKHRFLE